MFLFFHTFIFVYTSFSFLRMLGFNHVFPFPGSPLSSSVLLLTSFSGFSKGCLQQPKHYVSSGKSRPFGLTLNPFIPDFFLWNIDQFSRVCFPHSWDFPIKFADGAFTFKVRFSKALQTRALRIPSGPSCCAELWTFGTTPTLLQKKKNPKKNPWADVNKSVGQRSDGASFNFLPGLNSIYVVIV